jgi:GNAT superfamily N-acetyltransferase
MLFVLAAVVLGALVTIALVVAVVSRSTARGSVDVLTFAEPVRALSCALEAGTVDVVASTGDGAVVRRTVRHGRRRPSTFERLDGDRLVLESHRPRGWWPGWWWVDYEVHVPRASSVTAHTAAGRLSVAGVDGAVELTSQAGKLRVHATGGRLRLRSSAGSIEGVDLRSPEAEIRTEAGHVVLSFVAPPACVDVTATAGAIEVHVPGGPYAVDASSTAGRVQVAVPTDPGSTRRVAARSKAGSVRVVPAGPATTGDDHDLVDEAAGNGAITVTMERVDDPDGARLVADLLDELHDRYGEEDADAPDAHDLEPPDGAFLVARIEGRPVGCGALKRAGDGLGELKRMFVVPDARRTGVAAEILRVLEARAAALGYRRLRLETGVRQPEAIALYERSGYRRTANFPPYERAPLSVCFEKTLPSEP